MFKLLIIAAICACAFAKPGIPLAAPIAYANAPLYAAGGSSQVDVRNNYDGTLSSYTTAPFEFTAPYSSRYASGLPVVPPVYAAAPVVAKYTATPLAAPVPAPFPAAPYAAHLAAPYAAHLTAAYTSPFLSTPFAAAAAAVAAPAPVLV